MSGICGLFNFDGVHVTRAELAGMMSMLAVRGPDGKGLQLEGTAGLGHTLLVNTPEVEYEKQPVKDAQSGCVITADLRLDNREQLLGYLGLRHRRDKVSDAGLVLAAYLMWGENCVNRLLGDFAFAIFDPRERRLICARDPFGLKPLYYFCNPERFLAFASSPQSILTLPQVPYHINDGRVADFLVQQLEWIDYTSTFFDGVYRLPPGHKLIVTPAHFEVSEYSAPQPGPDPGFKSDKEWQVGFKALLTSAVDARLRAPDGNLGSMLSGGIDTGSIVCIATDLLQSRAGGALPTFSAVHGSDDSCAESNAIRAAQSLPGQTSHPVYLEAINGAASQLLSQLEEPFDGEAMLLKAVYRCAAANGVKVVLDGAGGDVILAEGSYIPRLLRRGRIGRAVLEIVGQNRFWGGPGVLRDMLIYGQAAYVPDALKRRLRPIKKRHRIASAVGDCLMSRELARQVDIAERFERMALTFSNVRPRDYATESASIVRPAVTAGRERYARLAAAFGCEARDPYMDRQLVEYAARLPERLRLRAGWPKIILRDLMSDRLPNDVLRLRGKPHLGWRFNVAVSRASYEAGELTLDKLASELADYVDRTALDRAWQAFESGSDCESVHTAHVLATWLAENRNRPVVSSPVFG